MEETMYKVGFRSAFIAFVAAAGFSIAQILQIMGFISYPWDEIFIYGFSLFIATPFMLALLALHYVTPDEKRFWSHAAVLFAVIYVTYVSLNFRRGEGAALGNLGNAYATLGETRKAIEFYEQHLAIKRDIGDRRGEGNDLWNMSLAQDKLGDRSQAINNARLALEIYEKIEDPTAERVRKQLDKWQDYG